MAYPTLCQSRAEARIAAICAAYELQAARLNR